MIVSRYKFLVRDGQYHLITMGNYHHVDHLDRTDKFISIMSRIEAMFADEEYVDCYQWLIMKKRKKLTFPMTDAKALDHLYREYRLKFRANWMKVHRNFLSPESKLTTFTSPQQTLLRNCT